MADDARYTPIYQRMYKARKGTIEHVFADAKEQHGVRYTRYTGLARVTSWMKIRFAAMNLKKNTRWRWRDTYPSFDSCNFVFFAKLHATPVALNAKLGGSTPLNHRFHIENGGFYGCGGRTQVYGLWVMRAFLTF